MQPPHSRRVNLPLTMVRVSPTLMPPCICAGPPGTSFVTCPVQVLFHQLPRFAARSLTGMPSGSVLTCRLPDGEGSSTAPMPTIESPDIFPPVFSADFVLARCTPRLGVAGIRAPSLGEETLARGFFFFDDTTTTLNSENWRRFARGCGPPSCLDMAVWEEAASRRVAMDVPLSDMEIRNTHADFRAPRRAAVAAAMVIVLGAAALAAALAGAAAGRWRPERVLKQRRAEDLSMFRDSSVSFFDPGDTAADSDILPREVLDNDGSLSDRADAERRSSPTNYADAHWYKAGQGSDPHGDLQDKNRVHRQRQRREVHLQEEVHEKREREAEIRRLALQREKQRQEQHEHQQVQMQMRLRRADAARERRRDRRELTRRRYAAAHAHFLHAPAAHPPSYQQMREQLRKEDAMKQAQIMKNAGVSGGKADVRPVTAATRYRAMKGASVNAKLPTTYAYKHPFAADKLGMQNLVMAEFSQDEHRMKATTAAIFGDDKENSKWRHGGLLLSDVNEAPPRTLHQAMAVTGSAPCIRPTHTLRCGSVCTNESM